jgi:hypothetical protein
LSTNNLRFIVFIKIILIFGVLFYLYTKIREFEKIRIYNYLIRLISICLSALLTAANGFSPVDKAYFFILAALTFLYCVFRKLPDKITIALFYILPLFWKKLV